MITLILQLDETQEKYKLSCLKDKNLYPVCKIYYGICECGKDYIGKTKRNTKKRYSEHDNSNKDSDLARHLSQHINHVFKWKILCHASKKMSCI